MKIEADRDACIASGNCVMVTDAVFDQDDDGVVVVVTDPVPEDEQDRAREAVKLCPSSALRLAD